MKRYKLKRKYKRLLTRILVVLIFILCLFLISNSNKEFMKDCMNQGYSKYYCEMHK